MVSVAENYQCILHGLSRRGIGDGAITVLGVTKGQPIELVEDAVRAGVRVFGNNYLQDGEKLISEMTNNDSAKNVTWHFIGHIQSRKAKGLVNYHCVQSVDRPGIARRMDEALRAINKTLDILVEINIGSEPQKSGVATDDVDSFLASLVGYSNLVLCGFMTLPPASFPVEDRARYFRAMRTLFDKYKKPLSLSCLSMGTSDDYLVAAAEGATMVRLGTALFGVRKEKAAPY